jgi:hypothetical protein
MVSGLLPGAAYDLTAAHIWASYGSWLHAAWWCWRTKATLGPTRISGSRTGDGTNPPRRRSQRGSADYASPRERANAQLKTWRILHEFRYCLWRAGQPAKTIQVLQTREIGG